MSTSLFNCSFEASGHDLWGLLRRNEQYFLGWLARYSSRFVADQLLILITDFYCDTRCDVARDLVQKNGPWILELYIAIYICIYTYKFYSLFTLTVYIWLSVFSEGKGRQWRWAIMYISDANQAFTCCENWLAFVFLGFFTACMSGWFSFVLLKVQQFAARG